MMPALDFLVWCLSLTWAELVLSFGYSLLMALACGLHLFYHPQSSSHQLSGSRPCIAFPPPETESVLSSNSFCISGSLHPTAAKSHPVVEYVVKSGKPAHYPRLSFFFFFTKSLFLTYTFFYLDYLTSGFRREPRVQFKQANALWICWFSGPVNLWISS